jgi:hypothetical protein
LCHQDYTWDDQIPEELERKWIKWKTDLVALKDVKIPRCYKPVDFGKVVEAELHHFSDASSTGYGQCSYIRQVDDQDQVHCALVMAKARVVPRKIVTIPRLELSAAVVSVQISQFIKEEIEMEYKEYFYTDSNVVLGYIANEARKFHVFVANRIERIKASTTSEQWRYVQSEQNPADLASRGSDVSSLAGSEWFDGPSFLWNRELPAMESTKSDVLEDDPEVRTVKVLATEVTAWPTMMSRLERFSDLHEAKKAVARAMKYVALLRSKVTDGSQISRTLTVADLQNAEVQIMKWTQEELSIHDKKSSSIAKLDPFLDNLGIWRVGGRLSKAQDLGFQERHPIILPKKSHVTTLVIKLAHEQAEHQGRGLSINEIRNNGF